MKRICLICFIICAITTCFGFQSAKNKANANEKEAKELLAKEANEKDITLLTPKDGIYVVKLNSKKLKKGALRPYFVTNLTTNEDVKKQTNARLVVNAGFFDPKNQQTISYINIDNKVILDPKNNTRLVENPILKPYLDKILNRTEFRILNCAGETAYDIAPHDAEVPKACYIQHSIQGGPALLPEAKLEEEFFILKKDGKIISESASSLRPYARTAIGIKNNNVYIIIATTKAPMSLEDLSKFAASLELEKAMAFDGGGSTSLDYEDLHIVSDKDDTARRLKSFLLVTQ